METVSSSNRGTAVRPYLDCCTQHQRSGERLKARRPRVGQMNETGLGAMCACRLQGTMRSKGVGALVLPNLVPQRLAVRSLLELGLDPTVWMRPGT
jgi:hypothetical protein